MHDSQLLETKIDVPSQDKEELGYFGTMHVIVCEDQLDNFLKRAAFDNIRSPYFGLLHRDHHGNWFV